MNLHKHNSNTSSEQQSQSSNSSSLSYYANEIDQARLRVQQYEEKIQHEKLRRKFYDELCQSGAQSQFESGSSNISASQIKGQVNEGKKQKNSNESSRSMLSSSNLSSQFDKIQQFMQQNYFAKQVSVEKSIIESQRNKTESKEKPFVLKKQSKTIFEFPTKLITTRNNFNLDSTLPYQKNTKKYRIFKQKQQKLQNSQYQAKVQQQRNQIRKEILKEQKQSQSISKVNQKYHQILHKLSQAQKKCNQNVCTNNFLPINHQEKEKSISFQSTKSLFVPLKQQKRYRSIYEKAKRGAEKCEDLKSLLRQISFNFR